MATLLESLNQQMTPEMMGTIGKAIGVDSAMVQRGLDVAGPLVQGSLAKKSQTTAGLDDIMKMMSREDSPDRMGNVGDMVGMLTKGGPFSAIASTGLLNGIFGQGVSAISKTLSAKLGFDVTPLLAAAIPMLLSVLGKSAKEQNLDSAGIANLLQTEQANFMANAKPEVLATLNEAMEAGDKAESVEAAFTSDEWNKVRLAPLAVTFYVMTASPSGPVGSMKELTAAGDVMKTVLKDAGPTSLVNVAFGSAGEKLDGEAGFDERSPRTAMLDVVKAASTAVKAKMPDEAQSFSATLNTLAQQVANASKEGGFLGIGGKQISTEEQQALNEIQAALA